MLRRLALLVLAGLLCACSVPAPTATPIPTPPAEIGADDRWIEVDLAAQVVRLHAGSQVVGEYAAASGADIESQFVTPAGLYHVQSKDKGPVESVEGVFCSDVIMFDLAAGLGIHSMPMDENGKVLDSRLGQPITAGCVRVGESAAVFDFAQLWMYIWIH